MKSVSFLNPLGFYNYCEEREFNPIDFGVDISADDKIISVTEDGSLLGVVKLNLAENELSLIGKDGALINSVELPVVDVVQNAYFDDEKDSLIIQVALTDGTNKDIVVPFNALLDDYATKEEVQKNAEDIATVNENLVTAINTINKNVNDGFIQINAAIKGNTDRIIALENQLSGGITNLEQEIAAREEADSKLSNDIAIVNNNLVTAINNYNNVVLPKITSDLNTAIMNETNARITNDRKLNEIITNLDNSVNESLSGITDTVAKLRADVEGALNQIASINDEQNNRLTALEEALKEGTVSQDELEAAVKAEQDRAIEAENALRELINSVNETLTEITESLSNRVTSLEEKITDIENNTTSVENTIQQIQNDINGLNDDIIAVNGRVDTLTTNVQSMIDELNKNVADSINTLNKNLVDAINTINGGIDEVREDLEEESTARTEFDAKIQAAMDKKVDWSEIADSTTRAARKAIIMENHDALMGKGTDGTVYNVAMVSKWNKADFGSSSIQLNLNGKAAHPTYNDMNEIAFLSDITATVGSIKLVDNGNGIYTLMVNGVEAGTITIPADKFIKNVSFVPETKELVFVFVTEQGEQTVRIDMSELVDTYIPGNGLEMKENAFAIKIDSTGESFLTVGINGLKLSGVQDAIDSKVAEAIKESEEKTDNLLDNKVDWTNISNESNPNRKAIVLKNHDTLLGTTTNGATNNIAMISKWDIVDLGTSTLPINLNTPKNTRVTVQEAGQTGEQAHKVAYVSDVEAEIVRAQNAENAIIGSENDDKDDLSLYGIKAYIDSVSDSIDTSVDTKIENALEPIEAQLGNFVTHEEAATWHDEVVKEANDYTDSQIKEVNQIAVNDAVEQAKLYTDEKIAPISEEQHKQANEIQGVENRCDHYDTLFGMILDEHDEGNIELGFYTKAETDAKIAEAVEAEKTRAEGVEADLQEQLDNTIKYEDVATTDNPNRKAIVLENHDTILGKDTNGFAYNLAMVSKWNKADFGSAQLPINLNGSEARPTYNDTKEIALLEDVNAKMEDIELVQDSELVYSLHVGDKIVGTINIPKDQFLKSVSYNAEAKTIDFVFVTNDGDTNVSVDISNLVDIYLAGNGLTLDGNTFSIQLDANTQKYIEVSEEGVKIVGIDEALAKKVEWSDASSEENPNRKSIVLNNHDVILGKGTNGAEYTIAMVSKWNKADFGSSAIELNLNGSAEHPTYNDEKSLAFVEEVQAEAEARSAKDTELQENIQAEAEARIAEDTAIKEALEKKVEYTTFDENRKTIELANHDTISGLKTDGTSVNIAMVSKWDKVDLGSSTVEMNLNGSAERPTYNDEKEIALLDDVKAIEVPKKLPNPEALTINYNGVQAFTYDGSKAETGNFIVNANTVPMAEDDVTTIAAKIDTLASKDELNAEIEARGAADTQLQSDLEKEAEARIAEDEAIKAELEKAVKYEDISSIENPDRKGIVLANHDTILGRTTDGAAKNLIMMSKWNKVDVGTGDYEINLNGSAARPTYNDEKEIALLEDINGGLSTIALTKDSDLQYSLKVGDAIVGTINIPKDQFLKGVSYDAATKDLVFVFVTSENDNSEVRVNISDLIDTYVAGNGLKLESNIFSVQLDATTQKYIEVSENGIKIVGVDEALAKKVDWTDVSDAENPNRNAIVMGNHDVLLGATTSGNTVTIGMVSKWDKVDLGSSTVSINLNGKDERPTYNDSKEIALMDDLDAMKESIQVDFPIRGLKDSVYDESTILGWFGVENVSDLKQLIVSEGQFYLRYGIQLSGNPMYYRMPIEYVAFESANQIKMVAIGLDTTNDVQSKYEIVINLDGITFEGTNSNVKMTLIPIASIEDIEAAKPDLSPYATVESLNVEIETRSAKDVELQENIEAEASARQEADSTINSELEKKADKSSLEGLASEDWVESKGYLTEHQDISNLATKTELEKVANSKLYYPGVKVDTQKLFALTKESTEDEIKAALQIKVASGGYTLPTAEIFDACLGKGYQLLSNWMPVSVVWNGAAYVLYIVGQSYMMKPTGLYTVAISINNGVYSVFQAAKFEEFANIDDLNNSLAEYQKVDVLTYDDDWNSAKAKVANGVKTIVDNDGLQWTITLVKEEPINDVNTLKVIASRLRSPYSDDIDTPYGFTFAQFTLKEGAIANSWSKVTSNGEFISEYTVNNLIDEKLITVNNAITLLNDKVSILENKYSMILKENSESIADFAGGDTINDATKSYSVSNANIESNSTINAKNIVLDDSTLSNNARLKVNSNNIEANNLNISGDFPKENGNSVISLNDAEYVVFKDMTFNSNNVYNGIEIGLNSEKLPKNILFENCKFEGTFLNNAILVFGTQNNATITLSNCSFDKLSNALRLSNKSNASGVTVNIINCSVNQWEETNKEFGGFLICEDYTSDASSVDSNNLFGDGKITINFMNLIHKGEKVIYSNASRCCGTKDENQVVYVYADNVGFVNYSENKYPIVSFK